MIGSNQALADACRANLDDLCPGGYHIEDCESSDASSGCHIYIWDYESSPSIPAAMVTAAKAAKVVLVKKSSLSSVPRKLPGTDFTRLQLARPDDTASPRRTRNGDLRLQRVLPTQLKLREQDDMDRSGSGLGLAICRMIVEARDGRIWADSGTQGSSFSFVLSLVRSFNHSHLSDIAA